MSVFPAIPDPLWRCEEDGYGLTRKNNVPRFACLPVEGFLWFSRKPFELSHRDLELNRYDQPIGFGLPPIPKFDMGGEKLPRIVNLEAIDTEKRSVSSDDLPDRD